MAGWQPRLDTSLDGNQDWIDGWMATKTGWMAGWQPRLDRWLDGNQDWMDGWMATKTG